MDPKEWHKLLEFMGGEIIELIVKNNPGIDADDNAAVLGHVVIILEECDVKGCLMKAVKSRLGVGTQPK
jgi:hypothetical protein